MQAQEGLKGFRNNWQESNDIPSITKNPKVQQAGTAVTPRVLPKPLLQSSSALEGHGLSPEERAFIWRYLLGELSRET